MGVRKENLQTEKTTQRSQFLPIAAEVFHGKFSSAFCLLLFTFQRPSNSWFLFVFCSDFRVVNCGITGLTN